MPHGGRLRHGDIFRTDVTNAISCCPGAQICPNVLRRVALQEHVSGATKHPQSAWRYLIGSIPVVNEPLQRFLARRRPGRSCCATRNASRTIEGMVTGLTI